MKTDLFTFSVGDVGTLGAGDGVADNPLVHSTVQAVSHPGTGCVLVVEIVNRDGVTDHLSHRHGDRLDDRQDKRN